MKAVPIAVAKAIPHARLSLIDGAGHSPFHPRMADALRAAMSVL